MLRTICILFLITCSLATYGQRKKKQKDPIVLFEINNRKISADEFVYLYNKNHQSKPNEYTSADIEEYLDLFVKFKLKVEEARQRGMDTTAAFLSEYNSYRNELIKPYLPDNKILDSLMAQAYERMKEEVRASHLLVGVAEDADPADTLAAFNKALELKARAMKGEDFGALAAAFSEDPSAKSNRGDLGFFTALQMVYPFETAAYEAKVGEVVGPLRTQFGYHLIKVTDRQPARGEVEVSHIMLRAGDTDENDLEGKAIEIHQQLMAGASWDELCRENSDDANSRERGGRLPAFGVGAMASVPEFERVAFSLRPGDISDPFKTAYGWHIVRVERKIPLPSFEDLKPELKNRIAADQRFERSRAVWIEKLKDDYGYKENTEILKEMLSRADSVVKKNSWTSGALTTISQRELFALHGREFNVGDFAAYGAKQRIAGGSTPKGTLQKLFERYVEEQLLETLGNEITAKKPEFRMLANEYYEGILLFDIMEEEVWNKATADSAGLTRYFMENRSKYTAGPRVRATIYSSPDSMVIGDLKRQAGTQDAAALSKYADKQSVTQETGTFEKGDREIFQRVPWSEGVYSAENKGMYYLAWIDKILPAGEKSLEEARASVIADYQQELEAAWIGQLQVKYPVKLNEKAKKYVFEQLQER